MIITVNGKEKQLPAGTKEIGYELISLMAYGKVIYGLSCTWKSKDGPGASLSIGQSVDPQDGLIFNICDTSKA